MNLLLATVQQEKERIEYMLQKYTQEYVTLPKGTICEKELRGKLYYYLKYRSGRRVISQYVSRDDVSTLREQLQRRKHIEAMLKSLREEQILANKILGDE